MKGYTDYAAIDAVNWSTLKHMRRSPLHYRHAVDSPRADTTRFALGRAAHTAVLEPDRFLLDYACYKGTIRRGKDWDAFKVQHSTETILKVGEYKTCLAIRDAVRSHPAAMSYLAAGIPEHSVAWTDADTGLACKGRMDWVSATRPAIVDIKTTSDVDEHRFGALCARMLYHAQLAFYADGYYASNAERLPVVIIAVEVTAPHDVAVYELDEDAIYAGSEIYRELLVKVASCRAAGSWPGRHQDQATLRLPAWAFGDEEGTDVGDDIFFGSSNETETATAHAPDGESA